MKSQDEGTVLKPEEVLLEALDRVCHALDIEEAHWPFPTEDAPQQKIASPGAGSKERLVWLSSEDALLFVRLYARLTTLTGSDAAGREWLRSYNTVLEGRPIDLLATHSGLARVVAYLESSA